MRRDRAALPAALGQMIEERTGPIEQLVAAPAGNHADIAATLHTAAGPIFVKAAAKQADEDGPEVRSLRWEAAINPHVTEFAPRLRWTAETGGWFTLAFDHIDGRHADYAPGSPDLELLAKTITALRATPCPEVVRIRVERRWRSVCADPSPMAGDALLHTDLNADNLIITTDGRAFLVDWAFVARGAPWVELGLLMPWLLLAGHTPAEAEAWAARFGCWPADQAHLDLFAQALAERWRRHASRADPEHWVVRHAGLTARWAAHRHMT